MSLRKYEEEKKFTFYSLTIDERKNIIEKLRIFFSKREEIILAIIYGGFTSSKIFRDIDIAVFTGYKVSYDKVNEYIDELENEVRIKCKIPITLDIKVLDYAPPSFKINVLSEGKIIIERVPYLALLLRWSALQEINNILLKRKKIHELIKSK